ncbi:Hippocampus abundant transcript 1 protein [Xenotaenia resolanae]|uniref:Hippocampus abundant transcript 1 protein n=1 Tax=Xenotaenia resolanae TaxID=208358 RepID=A0ABV0X7N3_9TELE
MLNGDTGGGKGAGTQLSLRFYRTRGFLSFLSAPLIGALSDTWGRKSFLLITVFFTCAPIPFMKISPWWYFALIAVSGIFAVTFSVIFAYVADVTEEHERSTAYGLVSATFAASLVTSPAIGAYLSAHYGDSLVVLVATVIAVADIAFVFFLVPESLPDKMRLSSWGFPISWEQADPFASLRRVGKDSTVLLICVTVFLSYLPEAGQYSSFFLYLKQDLINHPAKQTHQIPGSFSSPSSSLLEVSSSCMSLLQVIQFSPEAIAAFIAMVGILSIVAQVPPWMLSASLEAMCSQQLFLGCGDVVTQSEEDEEQCLAKVFTPFTMKVSKSLMICQYKHSFSEKPQRLQHH